MLEKLTDSDFHSTIIDYNSGKKFNFFGQCRIENNLGTIQKPSSRQYCLWFIFDCFLRLSLACRCTFDYLVPTQIRKIRFLQQQNQKHLNIKLKKIQEWLANIFSTWCRKTNSKTFKNITYSVLKVRPEKLICIFFTCCTCERKLQINFSGQSFSVQNNYFSIGK